MKTRTLFTVLFGLLLVGLTLYAWHLNRKVDELSNIEPVVYTDTVTVTDWQYDTVYQVYTKTETLKVNDTTWLRDTLTNEVYVQVEVPISKYIYDTLISTDSTKTHLRAVLEGFSVELDTLSIQWEIVHQEAGILPKKWYNNLAPAVGVGYGTSGFGFFVGLGYTLGQ